MGIAVSFTGSRPNKLLNEYSHDGPLSLWIKEEIKKHLLDLHPSLCFSGVALGVDTIAAMACNELKIPWIALVPFKGQELAWPLASQEAYWKLLETAKEVRVVSSGEYSAWKLQKRNEELVQQCDVLIAVPVGIEDKTKRSGTRNCIDYAESKEKTIIRIDPQDSGLL